jgi:hypothetical protein
LLENFASNPNETRVAIAHFNTREYELVNFNNFKNFSFVRDAILNMPNPSGSTNTAGALEYLNIRVMQEDNGMRDITRGVPKSIIVVTDGDSDNNLETIKQANLLKYRGFNMITVGIGNLFTNEKELIQIASSSKDAYKIDEYDKLSLYLNSLGRSAIQQPARIIQELEVNLNLPQDSYNYLKCQLNKTIFEESQFTVSLEYTNGDSDLFFSFEDLNPKSENDFIDQSLLPVEFIQNFVEPSSSLLSGPVLDNARLNNVFYPRNANEESAKTSITKYYSIKIPANQSNLTLFIGAKGNVQSNSLKIYVFNRTVGFVDSSTSTSTLTMVSNNSTFSSRSTTTTTSISTSISTGTRTTTITTLRIATTRSNVSFSKKFDLILLFLSLLGQFNFFN